MYAEHPTMLVLMQTPSAFNPVSKPLGAVVGGLYCTDSQVNPALLVLHVIVPWCACAARDTVVVWSFNSVSLLGGSVIVCSEISPKST